MAKQPFWKRKGKSAPAEEGAAPESSGTGQESSELEGLDLSTDDSGAPAQKTADEELVDDSDNDNSGNDDSGNEKKPRSLEELALNGFGDSAGDLGTEEAGAEAQPEDPVAALAAEYDREIKRLEGEIRENYDKYLRALAEGENIKKRALKDRADLLKYAGEGLARDIVEIVDDLENAVGQGGNVTNYSKESLDSVITGFRLLLEKFQSTLQRHGIKGESAVGQMLDPKKHEALATVPTADAPAGQVLNEFRKPYFFKDKLLRPGQVVVAAALPQAQTAPAEADAGGEEAPPSEDENSEL